MIIFETIKWKNFLSTGNSLTTINLNTHKTNLIIGKNGSGKSTILDALTFALFGKAFRNINKGNLINSINEKECLVEITFTTNGKKYQVRRGIKPTVFEIYCDDVLLNQDSASKDYQEYLEVNVLKMTHKSFVQIVILGSASFTPFMQLTPAERRLVIEDLLDIQIFTTMNTIVKSRLLSNKEGLGSNSIELKNKTTTRDFVLRTIEGLKESDQEAREALQKRKDDYSGQIEDVNNKMEALEKESQKLLKKTNGLKAKKVKQNKILVLKTQIEYKLQEAIENIALLEKQNTCPTCEKELDPTKKKKQLSDLDTKKKELERGLTDISEQLTKLEEEIASLELVRDQLDKINSDISVHVSKDASLHNILKGVVREIEQLNGSSKTMTLSKEELDLLNTEIEKLEGEKKTLLEDKVLAETAQLLLKDGGIKTRIIKNYIPIINKMINKYLTQMDFFVNFTLDENFNESIKSRYRDEFSYHSFSEGEKFRIDLSLLLTWRNVARMRNSVNCNLLILDEIFDGSLDSNGTDEFLKIMQNIDKDTNVYIISHKTESLVDKFGRTLKFEKVRNFSELT